MSSFIKKSIFVKLGLLFLSATVALIVSAYYLFDWSFTGTDNLLDAHDAYSNYKLVQSWGAPPDTSVLSKELSNLQIRSAIFYADHDTSCVNDTLLYWSNFDTSISLCDYLSFSDTDLLGDHHKISFPAYVSFGDFYLDNKLYQATMVILGEFYYLLVVDFVFPNKNFNVVPLLFLAVVFMLFLYLLVRRILSPINIIKKRIVALEKGDLSSKIKVLGEDELGVLSKNFNRLIVDIKNLLKQKERLLSDVSHELRSPLAKIRLSLAMIPSHNKVSEVDKQIKALDSLITNILLSDKMSSPYSNLDFSKIKISKLINDALDLTFVKNVRVVLSSDFFILVDSVKMSVALKNLIENAHKYDPSNKDILVSVKKEGVYVLLSVSDGGPGVPGEIKKTLTKAFVRGKNNKKSGFGLGLSICNKVVLAHKGSLFFKNPVEGGAVFTLRFPFK